MDDKEADDPDSLWRIIDIQLDEASIALATPEVDHERKVAIFDLLERNHFALEDGTPGPYRLRLSITENRLCFDISNEKMERITSFLFSLSPFSKLIKDYFLVC